MIVGAPLVGALFLAIAVVVEPNPPSRGFNAYDSQGGCNPPLQFSD
jgi:hypothetical protein